MPEAFSGTVESLRLDKIRDPSTDNMARGIGNRSSTDASREAAGEDETVVEPDQGNGEPCP